MILGIALGLTALAGGVSSLVNSGGGSGSGSGQQGYQYIPTDQAGADANYQSLFNMMQGPSSTIPGQLWGDYQNLYGAQTSNPYSNDYQGLMNQYGLSSISGAQQEGGLANSLLANNQYYQGIMNPAINNLSAITGQASNAAMSQAPTLQNAGLQTYGNLGSLAGLTAGIAPGQIAAGNTLLNTGYDPQNALYNQLQQKTLDSSNAINAMNGIAGTPYGAGVANQAMTNFNIDWENQQLQRQATAAQGYNNLTNSAGGNYQGAGSLGAAGLSGLTGAYGGALNAISGGAGIARQGYGTLGDLTSQGLNNSINASTGYGNMVNSALGLLQNGAGAGYNTYNTMQNNNMAALNNLTQGSTGAYGLTNDQLQNLAAYMGIGANAGANAANQRLQQFGMNQITGNNIGSGLNSLANSGAGGYINSLFGGGGGGGYINGGGLGGSFTNSNSTDWSMYGG